MAHFIGLIILKKLNEQPNSEAAERVARFIELFKEALDLHESFRALFKSREEMDSFLLDPQFTQYDFSQPFYQTQCNFSSVALEESNAALNAILRKLHKCTARYKWHPVIRHLGYEVYKFGIVQDWEVRTQEEEWENRAMARLCGDNGDAVARIRRCKMCENWFYAITDHQQYCRAKCRKNFASSSELFRGRRREYMRRYRESERERDGRAKALARRREQKRMKARS